MAFLDVEFQMTAQLDYIYTTENNYLSQLFTSKKASGFKLINMLYC